MLSAIFVYSVFLLICISAIIRPWLGVVGFYFFVVLDPIWNWRWAIDTSMQLQKFIFASILLGWLLNRMPGIRYRGKAALPIYGLVGFLILAYISSQSSLSPWYSQWYLGNLWKIFLMAVLAAMTIDSPRKLAVLLFAVVIAQGYNAYQINLQYFEDGFSLYARITNWGSKGDNNGYSILTIPVMAMSFGLAASPFRIQWRLLALAIGVLQIHEIMLLESRGSMLGAIVMSGFFLYFVPKNQPNVIAIGCLLSAAVLLAGPSVVNEFSSAFEDSENLDSSAQSRYHLWRAGWEITKDYPILGVGPFAADALVPDYYLGGGVLTTKRKALHNLFFELSTGTGIPATCLYLLFFVIPWWKCFRRRKLRYDENAEPAMVAVRLAVLCGIPGYFCASMFSSGALLETSYILAASGIAATAILDRSYAEYRIAASERAARSPHDARLRTSQAFG